MSPRVENNIAPFLNTTKLSINVKDRNNNTNTIGKHQYPNVAKPSPTRLVTRNPPNAEGVCVAVKYSLSPGEYSNSSLSIVIPISDKNGSG